MANIEKNTKLAKLLTLYKPVKVSRNIINKINLLYPKTKHYKYIEPVDIYDNILLSTVSLDLKKLHIIGRCIKIVYDINNNNIIDKILLYNPFKNLYWYIKPQKYYLFEAVNNKELFYKECCDDYIKNLKDK